MPITTYRPCSVEGCERGVKARELCGAHWKRWRNHGDALAGGTQKGALRAFLANALKADTDSCITWPFANAGNGYGKINTGGRDQFAHRVICAMACGEPPTPRHQAAHSCGQGHAGCINPRHLSWKTPIENNADKARHGTGNAGDANGMAKLTAPKVSEIRALHGQMTIPDIAARFGVSPSAIRDIHAGRRWSEVGT